MSDQFMREAIELARSLGHIAADQRARGKMVGGTRQELHEADADTCDDAAALLQKLSMEVTRLRQGIGCHHYGRLGGNELWHMAQSWNGDALPPRSSMGGAHG